MDLAKYAKDLQSLLDLMKRNDLAEVEIEGEGHKIRLRKSEPKIAGTPITFAGDSVAGLASVGTSVGHTAPDPNLTDDAESVDEDLHVVNSPLVGTFYRAPSPDQEAFVEVGDRVEAEQVMCIVEAMKVMNEIQAGVDGVIKEILAQNGDAVEFGEPLFRVDTQ